MYHNQAVETLDRNAIRALQLESLRRTVDQALRIPAYKASLKRVGVASGAELGSLEAVRRLPFTSKDDLRSGYPGGFLAVDLKEVVRLHTSSGTTGIPTVIYHTQSDLDAWTELVARCIVSCGAGPEDVFQNMTGYGMFTGGLGLHYGAEKVGMTVIPTGSGNSSRQLQYMRDFRTTIVHSTPSYLLHLHDCLEQSGLSLSDLALKRAIVGAEPYSESTRQKLESLWKISVHNMYGLSEMNGPGVAFECTAKNGMHLWEDAYFLEVIDPVSLEPVKPGEKGELVLTTLQRKATPLIRYRTRDIAQLVDDGPCSCGRTHARISRILGRSDDMLIINGVNVFPSQVEAVLMKIPEVGTNYQILLAKKGALDKMTVKVEIYTKLFNGEVSAIESLRTKISNALHSAILIHPDVELHEPGSLPVSQGKAVRVIDERPKL